MKPMTYKGYSAHIAGIADVIGFHADNVQDLRDAFGTAVDDYLALIQTNFIFIKGLKVDN